MFFVCNSATVVKVNMFGTYIDSRCNHMTSHNPMLINVDRNVYTRIKMGNEQIVQANFSD